MTEHPPTTLRNRWDEAADKYVDAKPDGDEPAFYGGLQIGFQDGADYGYDAALALAAELAEALEARACAQCRWRIGSPAVDFCIFCNVARSALAHYQAAIG